jgi:hypothetical protein
MWPKILQTRKGLRCNAWNQSSSNTWLYATRSEDVFMKRYGLAVEYVYINFGKFLALI